MLASKFGNGCCCRRFLIRFLNTLVLGEHIDGRIKVSSLSALAAASSLDQENSVSLLLAGSGSSLQQSAIHASTYPSISHVFVADSQEFIHNLAEPWARLTQILHRQHCFSHIITSSGSFGKNILPRAAAILNVSPVTDVIRVVNCNQFVRPIYAGNALCNVKYCGRSPCMLTIRSTSFPSNSSLSPSTSSGSSSKAPIQAVDLSDLGKSFKSRCLAHRSEDSGMPDLANARIVVSGGRGLKSRENFDLIEKIARRIGGAVGATRAAVDSGFVSNDMQIGQTGKIIAPDLYIAFGVSGAIQHLAGIRDSKVIVAVNKDADAPIFQVSDYGLVGDLFEIIPELLEKLPPK